MVCPLCGQRKARRSCPALGKQICAVCCGTKRLVEIQCPIDCAYLASAREHPAAAVVRQQRRDVSLLVQSVRDLNDRQSQLFVVINSALLRYEAPDLHPLIDDDVAEAVGSLASTYETAVRGVIYEHRPASMSAERLVAALKPLLAEGARTGGTAFERDAGVVLRKTAEAIRDARQSEPQNRRAYLDLLARTIKKNETQTAAEEAPRLIVP